MRWLRMDVALSELQSASPTMRAISCPLRSSTRVTGKPRTPMARDIPMGRTYAGVSPFVASDLIRVVILVAFPGITLWLVGVMF